MLRRSRSLLLLAACLGLSATPATTAGIRHLSEYSISLGVLPIARASFSSEFNRNDYRIDGSFKASGLVSLFSDISADTSVSGAVRGERLQARAYSLVYRQDRKTRRYEIRYRNGDVVSTSVDPEPKARPSNWIPVSNGDLHSVLDPLSGLIFPEGAKVCPSRLPIYDGESRLDLILSPKGSRAFSTEGYKGNAIVCEVRYVPKSGYKQGRSDIEYLKSVSMEVWFAKADKVNVYAPVYARIPTKVGDVYVTAVKYGG